MDKIIFLKHGQIPTLKPEMMEWVESVLPPEVHPERAQSFLLSRVALKLALESATGEPVLPHELKLENHHQLSFHPDYFASLSHTKDAAIAWVKKDKGFGIDLERLDRQIKDTIWDRIHHPSDAKSLSRMELWCLKEAAFKALFNAKYISGPIAFADIVFKEGGVWQWKTVTGHYQTSLQDQEWQVAKAWF